MYISRKQRAIINSAVKPFYITSNYLGTGLQNLLKFYSKYFARRRCLVQHFLPTYKNCRDTYHLSILFNAYNKKGGYAKKCRPTTWIFYRNVLLTKYGHKKQKKELKQKRKKERKRRQKQSTRVNRSEKSPNPLNELHKKANADCVIVLESSSSNGAEANSKENQENHAEKNDQQTEILANHNENETVTAELTNAKQSDEIAGKEIEFGDETVDNIWNLDIQEVAALITESVNDEKQLNEAVDDANEDYRSNQNQHEEDAEISIGDEGQSIVSGAGDDINEKIRQQLKLLKMGKCENSLFTSKETRTLANTRSTPSSFRRSNSNAFDESKKTSSFLDAKCSSNESQYDAICPNGDANTAQQKCDEQIQTSKTNGGIIDSLFNKFQSIGKVVPVRLKSKIVSGESAVAAPTHIPSKRYKRDETVDGSLLTTFDSNPDDSNQSTNSVAVEFLGFDIANKNVDVSALLPTPKVVTSNEQAAFVSEYLDTFMKENSLENANVNIRFAPKRHNADEALMTTDALPPNLSVPERPMDMQRPRTLAEKRMILQQQNDISLLIIENESTVYHELKKRVKQGTSYDNSLMRSIQDAHIPFTRDCWRAACWISTSNNRFLYRTILFDGMEIKLVGSRGDNMEKVAIDLNTDEKKTVLFQKSKRTLADCSMKCPPIDGVRINNIDAILDNTKVKTEDVVQSKEKNGLLKKSRLCMFSREYLTPGPKCKKLHCKSNRKSSFDLEYGPLELVHLPTVQLEVWPQVGIPLPDHIKPILKAIPTNSNIITSEWAKFAVSVVRENPKQIKHRRKYKKPEIDKPQSITFSIAYENHEKMILIRRRRRSAIVFNKSDTKHEQIELFYQNNDDNQLSFAKHVDPSDTFAMECASILTKMIDSVAIAVNDTNFIKRDPDIDYVGKIVPLAGSKDCPKSSSKGEKDKPSAKNEKPAKSKLMKELKRLNVTVIDTATELVKSKKSDEICQKLFCKMGCICESIDNAKYIQVHCQRYECMFSCSCTNTPFSEKNPFYLNNSIDLLQARANARLAKEEKEFKSTIIVSENDMFVLPSSSTATKRSSKKPKRFTNDETCVDDTETETIFNSKRRRQAEKVNMISEYRPDEIRQRSNFLKSLQHVHVELKPLPDLGVEPWCMVHCLYKCHCKGRAQKGRIFNFANKKNDMTGPGGWDNISPRKRQYTFERDIQLNVDEPLPKIQKPTVPLDVEDPCEPWASSARTSILNWQSRSKRSAHEWKALRNERMFIENPLREILNEKIIKCRQYNHAQNTLTKSMENGRLISNAKSDPTSVGSINSRDRTTSQSLQQFNHVITDTMHRLTALQERNKLLLNPTPNKLSVVPWDRMMEAFKVAEVFIWDITLKNNLRLLALTKTYLKPKSENYLQVTNIHYADINSLPMIGKLLRKEFQSEKSKYLAMVLLRITHFWRICGVIHSDLKYMDDELRAKPTPDKNPLLGRKINTLYRLLTSKFDGRPCVNSLRDTKNDTSISNKQSTSASSSTSSSVSNNKTINTSNAPIHSNCASFNWKNEQKLNDAQKEGTRIGDENGVNDVDDDNANEPKQLFQNASMNLRLPIPITVKQRVLMIHVGDDFTHAYCASWGQNKFLNIKRIQNGLRLAKQVGKAIDLSQSNDNPKVCVSHKYENCIFLGPYEQTDGQNIALFVKHNNHMMLSEEYYKKFNATYLKKTKATWILPTGSNNKQTIPLKSDQLCFKDTFPTDQTIADPNIAMNKKDTSKSANESNQATTNGHFAAISAANGIKAISHVKDRLSSKSPTPVSAPKMYMPTKIAEVRAAKPTNVWGENLVMQNPCRNSNALPLKISSVASGESVALMANDLPITADELADERNDEATDDGSNSQPKICDVKLHSDKQSNTIAKFDEPNDNACDPMTCPPNKYGEILITTKTEPIDISDDDGDVGNDIEQNDDFQNTTDISPTISTQTENVFRTNGYIYCTTNLQLGKVNLEYTSANKITLHLKEPVEIFFDCWPHQKRGPNLANVTKFMQTYIREKFYSIYPSQLRFDWVFTAADQFDQDAITLCDFNTLDPFSVVFKDKIIPINSNYREDAKIQKNEIYVVNIYQLASHLFSEEDVKKMNISEIIKKSKEIDAELIERQNELNRVIANREAYIARLIKKNQTHNGDS